MTLDTVFWIASMTKAITATAALCLLEQGKLSLDDPIRDVLPELAAPRVLEGFTVTGQPQLRPANKPITLRHMLTHTAGFGYFFLNPDLLRYLEQAGIPDPFTGKNACLDLPLSFDPGERWQYGMGIEWAGKAIERVSGRTLQQCFEELLFGPLVMKDTGFEPTAERRARLAGMHARQSSGSLEPLPFELFGWSWSGEDWKPMPQGAEFQSGGGALYNTAADYLAFEQLFLRQGRSSHGPLLRPETMRLVGQNQIGELELPPWRSAIPAVSNSGEFLPGIPKKWSLAFLLNTTPVPGGRSVNSLAWAGIFNTYYWIDPAKGVAGVLLTQILPFLDSKVLDLLDRFEKAIYAILE